MKNCDICGKQTPDDALEDILERKACYACRVAIKSAQSSDFEQLDLSDKELLYQIRNEQRSNTWLLRAILIIMVVAIIPFDGSVNLGAKPTIILAIAFVALLVSVIGRRKTEQQISANRNNKPENIQETPEIES